MSSPLVLRIARPLLVVRSLLAGLVLFCWRSSWVRFCSGGVGGVIKLALGLTLLLSLQLGMLEVVKLRPAPAVQLNRVSLFSSISRQSKPAASFRLLTDLCASNETTTTTGEAPSPLPACDPTDVSASQTLYLIIVTASLILFALFFLLGFRLWT
jgi:hypothetical protein